MLLGDFLSAFRAGKELANATIWKNRTLAGNALVALFSALLAIAAGFGYRIDADRETLEALAAGVAAAVAVINSIMHVVTSARVGLPAEPPPIESGAAVNYRPEDDRDDYRLY